MLFSLARNWQILAFRGVVAVIFGALALLLPGITLVVLIALFGVYALATGILSGILAFAERPDQPQWLFVLEAIAGILAGVVAFALPGLTAVSLLFLIGAWALATGMIRIASAISLRAEIKNAGLMGVNGALTVLLGLLILARPAVGALAVVWLIGSLAIAFGLFETILAFRLRNLPPGKARVWSIRAEEEARRKIKK